MLQSRGYVAVIHVPVYDVVNQVHIDIYSVLTVHNIRIIQRDRKQIKFNI